MSDDTKTKNKIEEAREKLACHIRPPKSGSSEGAASADSTEIGGAQTDFIDESGKVLGKHKGIIHYTVGQRKGLGIALGYPAYVKQIKPETNEVVLGASGSTYCDTVYCRDLNFMSIEEPAYGEKLRCQVKIRYRHPGQDAVLEKESEGRFRLSFDEPVRSATPGQSAVFYDANGDLIGGGIISEAVFS